MNVPCYTGTLGNMFMKNNKKANVLLSRIESSGKREFYMAESTKNHWTFRQMKHQVNSLLYLPLLLSSDKESVLAVACGERQVFEVREIVKNPMYLEFLGLKRESSYYEKNM